LKFLISSGTKSLFFFPFLKIYAPWAEKKSDGGLSLLLLRAKRKKEKNSGWLIRMEKNKYHTPTVHNTSKF